MTETNALLASIATGDRPHRPHRPDGDEAAGLATETDTAALMAAAAALRDAGHGDVVTYSRKVFIPLTRLCRDVCHYCTFAAPPGRGEAAYMTPDEVLAVARAGAAEGCKEALFTLGDKPELRYRAARAPPSGTRRRFPTWPRWRAWSSRRPASWSTPTPAS